MTNEELKQKIMSEEVTDIEIYEAEKLLSQDDFHKYTAEVESKKKNMVVGILLSVFLSAFGAPLFYYGLDAKNAKVMGILLIVGWITIYFLIGSFIILAVEIWSLIMIITTWAKADELKVKKETIVNYL